MLSLDQAIAAVGKRIGERIFNDEMSGGYGLVTLNPGEVLEIVYGKKGIYRALHAAAKARREELCRQGREGSRNREGKHA